MLDFSPEMLWEYGKLFFLSIVIGAAVGFAYTYTARKLLKRKDVRKEFNSFLFQFVAFSVLLCAISLAPILGKASFMTFLFVAFTEFVRYLAIPWMAAMVVAWKYVPPWELLRPGYYKKG